MKSDQFFKIYKCFDKERENTLIEQSIRKEKTRKAKLYFITVCFTKPFKMKIDQFFFISQALLQRNFCFLISGWRKKYQEGKLAMANR